MHKIINKPNRCKHILYYISIFIVIVILASGLFIANNNKEFIIGSTYKTYQRNDHIIYENNNYFRKFVNDDYLIMPTKTEEIEKFDWIKDVSDTIGTITISEDGKSVNMTGNYSQPGKNAIYILPEAAQEQHLTFDYDVEFGDSFIAAGIILKVKKSETDNTLHGYMLSFNHSGHEFYNESENSLGAIWTFTYKLGENTNNVIDRTLVQKLDIPIKGSINVDSTEEGISITGNDDATQNVNVSIKVDPENEEFGYGYGFFTDHYSHGCDQFGHFNLTNFGLITINILPHDLEIYPNGGIYNGSTEKVVETGKYEDTREIPVPTREGYTFAGWTKTGTGGTMSDLYHNATYTFGEDEVTDTLTAQWARVDLAKKCDVETGKVIKNQEITYTITATNLGTVQGNATIKDTIPVGTTFVENSITLKGEPTEYTEQNLRDGINVTLDVEETAELSFKVKVNDLDDKALISNIAYLSDKTVQESIVEKQSNQIDLTYVEPIISQNKEMKTEYEKEYVINGEKITYYVNVKNDGGLNKEVNIIDKIPEETTFVEGSIKLNGEPYTNQDQSIPNQESLENGILVNVPEYGETQVLSFEVIVNDNEDEDIIKNIAIVDDIETNEVSARYIEPIITQTKKATTEYNQSYVASNEKITYSIEIENAGGLEKEVILKDAIPEGTTFVDGSIKLNGEEYKNDQGNVYTKEDIAENGIKILIPSKVVKDTDEENEEGNLDQDENQTESEDNNNEELPETPENQEQLEQTETPTNPNEEGANSEESDQNETEYTPSKTILSFDVTVNPLENDTDTFTIRNVATIDENKTNEVTNLVLPFNMKIEKSIKQITVTDTNQEITNNKLIKIEVRASKVKTTNIKVKYNIVVTNTGSIDGTAVVQDIVPQGFKVSSENPSYWSKTSEGNLQTTTDVIKAGESKELQVILEWENSNNNFGDKENIAKIIETNNISNAVETSLEDNNSSANVIMAVRTGDESIIKPLIPVMSVSFSIIIVGAILIKKFVLL